MKLSIIVPVYNEEKTVDEILNRIFFVKLPASVKKEIIVVDDGSTDDTSKKIATWKEKKIIYIRHNINRGKGAAVKIGISNSSGDLLIIQDADLEYDPRYYPTLLKPFLESNAKVVFGSRLIDYPLKLWGKQKTVLPSHLIANKVLTFLTNLLYGSSLTDMETGFKLFKKSILNKISIKSNKFDFEPEITAKILKLNIPIIEIPIVVSPRTYQEGKKISWTDGFSAVWTLIKYKFIS